ncbi:hypothetical protein [Photobacterium damselae]|uniref:hypothetical protein n=1 Tax=Photobacterium damselae TaxID=38293 RepID=UPI001F16AAD1|nr:hypothetical protein [Photobacterium damselae]UKA04520.1 hypothetical protein IHC89_23140 [Photobacterium damselae subsp. damselae]
MNEFYIGFLEECLRKGSYKMSISRAMSLSELDYYQSVSSELLVGKFDIDAEQRLELSKIESSLRNLERIVNVSAVMFQQCDDDMSFCENVFQYEKYFSSNKVGLLDVLKVRRQRKILWSEFKSQILHSEQKNSNCLNTLKSSKNIETIDLSHLQMIAITLEKAVKSKAVIIFGEDGRRTPSSQELDVFRSLDTSYAYCSKLILISKKIQKFLDFAVGELVDFDATLQNKQLLDEQILGGSKLDFDAVKNACAIRSDIKAVLGGVGSVNVSSLKSEFKVIKDYHSTKIVNDQIF